VDGRDLSLEHRVDEPVARKQRFRGKLRGDDDGVEGLAAAACLRAKVSQCQRVSERVASVHLAVVVEGKGRGVCRDGVGVCPNGVKRVWYLSRGLPEMSSISTCEASSLAFSVAEMDSAVTPNVFASAAAAAAWASVGAAMAEG
jgi:hypothetical protein